MGNKRIFTGDRNQKFTIRGIWNNKVLGAYDIDPTYIPDLRPALIDLDKGPNQAPVVFDIKPFVRGGGNFYSPKKDTMCFQGMLQRAGGGVVFDMTTNPKVVVMENPSPGSLRMYGCSYVDETGVYGNSFDSSVGGCKWDFSGKLLQKNLNWVRKLPTGEPFTSDWCQRNVTLPNGYDRGFGNYDENSGWVFGSMQAIGSTDMKYHSFIFDPTGKVPGGKFFLPCDEWESSRVLDASIDGRFVALRTVGIDKNYNTKTDMTWMVDTFTDTKYNLKELLGLDPWLAYQVYDVDFCKDGTNRFVTTSVSKSEDGKQMIDVLDLWDPLA